jgi:hypothetical protein
LAEPGIFLKKFKMVCKALKRNGKKFIGDGFRKALRKPLNLKTGTISWKCNVISLM